MEISIVIDAPRAHTSDDFLIRDLPGTSGRLDVVCRILVSAFRTVPKFAPYIEVNAVLGGRPNPTLRLKVEKVKANEFPASELECALILKGLLLSYRTLKSSRNPQRPQFKIEAKNFRETIQEAKSTKKQSLYLTETGQPLSSVDLDLNQPMLVILGDDQGLSSEHEKEVYSHGIQEVSIGTRSLLGSQVVSLFLLELLRREEKT